MNSIACEVKRALEVGERTKNVLGCFAAPTVVIPEGPALECIRAIESTAPHCICFHMLAHELVGCALGACMLQGRKAAPWHQTAVVVVVVVVVLLLL